MRNSYFKKGQVLTADALNSAIASIVPGGAQSAPAVPVGGLHRGKIPHTITAAEYPVYLDKFSMMLPADGQEGWYARVEGELTRLAEVKSEAAVHLVLETDATGVPTRRYLTSTAPAARMWDPATGTTGVVVRKVGETVIDPLAAGTAASVRNIFMPAAAELEPRPVNAGLPPLPDCLPVKEEPLLLPQQGNSWPVRKLQSAGGLLFLPPFSDSAALRVEPRVNLFYYAPESAIAPATPAAPATEEVDYPCTLRMGEWQKLARLRLGDAETWLTGAWVTPWKVALSFQPEEVPLLSGGAAALEKMAWWGSLPVLGENPHGLGPWKRVSYTPGVTTLLVPEVFPADCSFVTYDYAVYEAPGTTGDSVDEPSRRVTWVAQMRRQTAPSKGAWEQHTMLELTAPMT